MPTATRTTRTRKASARKSSKVVKITAGEAWEALGADEKYKPKNMKAGASNRMLWALNEAGKLAIV